MYLNNIGNAEGYGSFPSNLEIGSYNLTKYSKFGLFEVTIPIVMPAEFWKVVFDSIFIGTKKISQSENSIIDSGTSLLFLHNLELLYPTSLI